MSDLYGVEGPVSVNEQGSRHYQCLTCTKHIRANWRDEKPNSHICCALGWSGECVNFVFNTSRNTINPANMSYHKCNVCGNKISDYRYTIIDKNGTWSVRTTSNRTHSITYMASKVGFKYIELKGGLRVKNLTAFETNNPPVAAVFSKPQSAYLH